MADLFAYVVVHDIGFAPNPFHGVCTLATCKPRIRRVAQPGDWLAGIGSRQKGQHGHLVFAMLVEEVLSYDKYWDDPRFLRKRPHRVGSLKQLYGDNIYHRAADGHTWIQEDGRHSLEDGSPNLDHVRKDTSVPRVLASCTFAYYGDKAVKIPNEFRCWEGKDYFDSVRDYQRNFPEDLRTAFTAWLETQSDVGVAGAPLDWS
ncbi:hypothetical protein [Candidatus Poriferisodalis sp.]|uniref:Nmad2 family putative nucleotide modification protein n=1 Tax=Candidatus Poriferisodalis sp. TaxID=3101277 RepID=UPI003B029532